MSRRGRATRQTEELEELASMIEQRANTTSTPLTDRVAETRPELLSIETLTQALQLAGLGQKREFKPPSYGGEGDVELFISQFEDVADANRWEVVQRTLHLRAQLHGTAQECGRARDYEHIVADLRARFGMSRQQAKERLSHMRRNHKQSIHELATEISRLVQLGYPTLSETDRDSFTMDYMLRILDNRALQRHMLAMQPTSTLEAARAAEEFLAVGGERTQAGGRVMPVGDEAEDQAIKALERGLVSVTNAISTQSALLTQLIEQLGEQKRAVHNAIPQNRGNLQCYGCGGPHLKRNCPGRGQGVSGKGGYGSASAGARDSRGPIQGNEQGPAQA